MLRVTQTKNALLDGATIAEDSFRTSTDFEKLFESLDKFDEAAKPRTTFIRAGVLSTVRGSAYIEYGNTKMMAIVAPPHEMVRASARRMNMGVLNCYVNYAAFSTGQLETVPQREKQLSSMLTKALEPVVCRTEFLNFQLDVRVLIIEDDGCLLSTAINCCGVALVECGISTYDLITASTVCIYRDHVFINPSATVEELLWKHRGGHALPSGGDDDKPIQEHGMLMIASMETFDQLAQCQQTGYLSPVMYTRLLDLTLTINKRLRQLIRQVLLQRVKEQHDCDLRQKIKTAEEDKRLAAVIERLKQQGLHELMNPSNIKEDHYSNK